jgi:DNA-binding response OmpR family regulator
MDIKTLPSAKGTILAELFAYTCGVDLDPSHEAIVTPDGEPMPGGEGLPTFSDVPEPLRRALVVEDDLAFSSFLVKLLTAHGFSVQVAFNGEEGLKMALAHQPWIILTDVRMPGVDGFELCRQVRSHSLTRHTPVIFLSGWDDFKSRYKGLDAGADEYLPKSTPVRELLMRIHLLLRRYSDLGPRPGAGRSGLAGRLDVLGAPGLLQICNAGQMTGVLTVRGDGGEATVRFKGGQLLGAECGQLRGRQALYEMLAWTDGHFEFAPGDAGAGDGLDGENFEEILLEGCRLLDERRRPGGG